MLGVASAAALTNAVSNCLYLREVRRALQISPYNRTYLPPDFALSGDSRRYAGHQIAAGSFNRNGFGLVYR